MNQLVFILAAAVPTAWLLWRRGWIDRKRRFGLILAIVTLFYFIVIRSLPERNRPQASVELAPTAEEVDALGKHAAAHANNPIVHNEAFPSGDSFRLSARAAPTTQSSR